MPRTDHDHAGGSEIAVAPRLHRVVIATGLCMSSVACSVPPAKGRCYATYRINGDRFAWAWVPDGLCGGDFEGRFTRSGDHLRFTFGPNDQNGAFYRGVFKGGLVRIGDVP